MDHISQKRGLQILDCYTFLERSKVVLSGYKIISMDISSYFEQMAIQVQHFTDFRFSLVSRPLDFWVRGQGRVGNTIFGCNFLSTFRIYMVISTLKQYLQSYEAKKVLPKTCHFGGFWQILRFLEFTSIQRPQLVRD